MDWLALLILFVIMTGLFLNLVVVFANNGLMPVATDDQRRIGPAYQYLSQDTKLNGLCDIFLIPKNVPLIGGGIASIGDILAFFGTVVAYGFITIRLVNLLLIF